MKRRLIYTVFYFSKNVKDTIQLHEFAIDKSVKINNAIVYPNHMDIIFNNNLSFIIHLVL